MDDDIAQLGFAFLPNMQSDALGYGGVDIALVDQDEASGFAPAKILFHGVDTMGAVCDMRLSILWSGAPLQRVAPGLVIVQTHDGDELTIYCFGGELACRHVGTRIMCHLGSAAPIFNLSEEGFDSDENAVLSVVDNLEGEFAEQRARYTDAEEVIFAQRLANADPRHLYAVGLMLAHHAFKTLPEILHSEHYWEEYGELARALAAAKKADWWPPAPTLDAILATPSHANPSGAMP